MTEKPGDRCKPCRGHMEEFKIKTKKTLLKEAKAHMKSLGLDTLSKYEREQMKGGIRQYGNNN